jgi:hypothetical protein
MRLRSVVAASLLAGTFCVAPASAGDDAPPPAKPPADAGKASDAKKDEPTLRVEAAKILLKELEEAIERVRATQPMDPQLLAKLMEARDRAKALANPAKPAELTADEKKAVVDEAKKDAAGGAPPPKDPGQEWAEKQLAKAFDGADLSEEESIKATKIIQDWFKEQQSAWGDSKKSSDLKRKRDDDLEKAIGAKKAHKVINNLNAMGPGRR